MTSTRRQQALDLRIAAAQLACRFSETNSAGQRHSNSEEENFRAQNYLASFTKGLPHNVHSGLLRDAGDYRALLASIRNTRDATSVAAGFNGTRANPQWSAASTLRFDQTDKVCIRDWEGIHAGLDFSLAGPDAQSLTLAPPPALGSAVLTREMAELYALAQLRDAPLALFTPTQNSHRSALRDLSQRRLLEVRAALQRLAGADRTCKASREHSGLQQMLARQMLHEDADTDEIYLSQFLLCGTHAPHTDDVASDGMIVWGAQRFDQRVRRAPNRDYATTWNEWLDLQHGADLCHRGRHPHSMRTGDDFRFITTARDLAAYVHQAAPPRIFMNACLILLGLGYGGTAPTARWPMAHGLSRDEFGGHSLFALLAQAANSAIAAARFQQYQVHRRLRPEALAARLEKFDHPHVTTPQLSAMFADLVAAGIFNEDGRTAGRSNRLLPMAWIEGSPMAPSYCSAYAAAAGACATVMKAFFDDDVLDITGNGEYCALLPTDDGRVLMPQELRQALTIGAEIDKLACNLAVGRCWAGVSFHSDIAAGLDLGEKVATCLLNEIRLLRSASKLSRSE
jgi:hypothetical protein